MRTAVPVLFALCSLSAPALAGSRVEERRPAKPDGLVAIENGAGSIRVTGWDRAEVAVTGTLGSGAEGLEFTTSGHRTAISVEVRGNPHGVSSHLDIHVPAGSRLEIETFGAAIEVSGVKGSIKAENVNSGIVVADSAGEVDVETVNGPVEVSGPSSRVRAESVNGTVTVRGAKGEVEASTVNGRLAVSGGTFDRVVMETVNGSIRFEGALQARASVSVDTVGGAVEIVLPADVSADFSVYTFSGSVLNELGPAAHRKTKYTSEKELVFSTGSGGAKVTVETLSGAISLRKR